MKKIKKILVPIDLSASAVKLVPVTKLMSAAFGATIDLLFVARVFDYYISIYVPHPSIDRFEDELAEGANKRLAEFKAENFSDTKGVTANVVQGDAANAIIDYAHANDVDLIVMGTHGRKGLDRTLFGSVAERVVQNAAVPVLTVNPYKVEV
jgi:nucleotide-binding universal stress UspA family protein